MSLNRILRLFPVFVIVVYLKNFTGLLRKAVSSPIASPFSTGNEQSGQPHRQPKRTTSASTKIPKQVDQEQQAPRQIDSCSGKERLVKILVQAGMQKKDINCEILPRWTQYEQNYGSGPSIVGLDRCGEYKKHLNGTTGHPRVVGMFNTGTNHAAKIFEQSLDRLGNRYRHESPHGKHLPARYFGENIITTNKDDIKRDPSHVLPVVIVRDPFLWMKAMCRKSYDVHWLRPSDSWHCPILLPSKDDLKMEKFQTNFTARARVVQAQVRRPDAIIPEDLFPSIAHVWASFYQEWINVSYPRLIVRTEDLVFHGPRVVDEIAQCAGFKTHRSFRHNLEAAKSHGSSNLLQVMSKYKELNDRYGNLTKKEVDYVRGVFTPNLLRQFNYPALPKTIDWKTYSPRDVESIVEKRKV